LGLLAAIEGRVYPLNAVAVTNTWYLKIPTKMFVDLYAANANLQDTLLRSLAPRLRRAHEMMARMSSGKIEQRLAAVLLILTGSYGRESRDGTALSVPLTRQDLSEMAGTTIETTIRVMSRWQKKNVLTTDHQLITIHDTDFLEAMLAC
jgi:CRP-like cAMP-binding protein